MAEEARLKLIQSYFHLSLKYKEIVHILNERHGISLSERQLIRILKKENLFRYKRSADIMTVVEFILREQRASGALHGYRWMYQKMKCRGIDARKEEVRILMGLLDPEGRDIRQKHKLKRRLYLSKGPNYIWHLDSYDKLRPYGICINGCIDGFSRKVIWLNAYYTSSDPRVIGGYYLEALEKQGGCPVIVRGDRGTENNSVCNYQRFFRRNGNDAFHGERSFLYGRSTSNQRIESWWNFLRRECIEFWLVHFDILKRDGYFDGDYLDKNILLFCFLALIQVGYPLVCIIQC